MMKYKGKRVEIISNTNKEECADCIFDGDGSSCGKAFEASNRLVPCYENHIKYVYK